MVSFISIEYVVVKLKIFNVFCIDSASRNGTFLGFFGLLLPQILFDLAEIFFSKTDTLLKNLSKFCILAQMRCTQKFTVLVHFGTQFTARKTKILLKTTIFAKTTFLEMSNNVSPRSQKNQRVLVPLNKKEIFLVGDGGGGGEGGG